MKLLFCKECGDVISMTKDIVKSCRCGNAKGKYDDNNSDILVKFKNIKTIRIIGITNGFLNENPEPMDLLKLTGTLFGEKDSYIINNISVHY